MQTTIMLWAKVMKLIINCIAYFVCTVKASSDITTVLTTLHWPVTAAYLHIVFGTDLGNLVCQ